MNPRHRRSPRNLTLNKAYPEWYDSKGVFSSMSTAPWASDVSLSSIDIAYHGEHSGEKFVAPLIYHFVDDDGEVTQSGYAAIANMLLNRYGAKWEHLWGLYTLEYGVLNSYNLVETRHREATTEEELDNTHTVQRTDTHNHPTKTVAVDSTRTPALEESTTVEEEVVVDGTKLRTANLQEKTDVDEEVVVDASDVRTANLTEETTVDEDTTRGVDETTTVTHGHVVTTDNDTTDNVTNSKYGFNSAAAVPTDSSSSTGTSDTTETHSGQDVTVVDSDETGTKDSTTTKETTGTDRHDEDSTTTKDSSTTLKTTGTDTIDDDSTTTKEGTTTKSTSGTEEYSETEVESYTGTDSLVKTGSETDARDGSTSEEEDVSTTKTGNIFKSPAELMMADRDFWLTDFFSIVFEDVDQMITLAIYPERTVRHLVLTD